MSSATGQVVMALVSVLRCIHQHTEEPCANRGGRTDLLTCCPPGPLERANTVVPLGREASLTLSRHFLASDKSAGSSEASNAENLASLFHGASWMEDGGGNGRQTRLGSLIRKGLVIV